MVDGVPSALTGRPLIALARLALARAPISAERLRDDVWPNDTGTLGNVQVTLSRLRTVIGGARIARSGAGYNVVGVLTDAQRFEESLLIARSQDAGHEARLDHYDTALALWTGPAHEGVRAGLWFDAEARRLDDLRESTIDERYDLMLAMGRERQAVDELRAAVALAPAREPRAALLMLALYRCGLQREALSVFERLRHELREHYAELATPGQGDEWFGLCRPGSTKPDSEPGTASLRVLEDPAAGDVASLGGVRKSA